MDSVIGYVGIHDINYDNIPELIMGDLVSVGVFTFEDGIAKNCRFIWEGAIKELELKYNPAGAA